MRILFDGRLLDGQPTGVRDIAQGLVMGLRELERAGLVELQIAYDTRHEELGAAFVPRQAYMALGLPASALVLRADRILIPRQTVPPFSPVKAAPVFHDIGFLQHPDLYPNEKRIEFTTRVAARSRFGLAVSEFTASEMRAQGLGDAVTALPISAVHQYKWKPIQDSRYITCVAAQQPHKNLIGLLRAWNAADTDGVKLVICGRRGKASVQIDEFLAQSPKRSTVQIRTDLTDEEYGALLEGSWGYVQPSLYEGLCIPALDMAAAGTPMAVSSAANLGLVFRQAPNSQVFAPKSLSEMTASIEKLIFDQDFRLASSAFNLANTAVTDWSRVAEVALRSMQ